MAEMAGFRCVVRQFVFLLTHNFKLTIHYRVLDVVHASFCTYHSWHYSLIRAILMVLIRLSCLIPLSCLRFFNIPIGIHTDMRMPFQISSAFDLEAFLYGHWYTQSSYRDFLQLILCLFQVVECT